MSDKTKVYYIVKSYGGCYEDAWEHNEAVTTDREKAEAYVTKMTKLNAEAEEAYFQTEELSLREEGEWEAYVAATFRPEVSQILLNSRYFDPEFWTIDEVNEL